MRTSTRIHVALLLGVLAACGRGNTTTPPGSGSGSVTVAPKSVTVEAGDTAIFTATVQGASSASVSWSVQGGAGQGTITREGVYTAPAEAGSYTVVATSTVDPTRTDSATVTVTASLYRDPPATGWRLVRNASASSGNTLVLDLMGPSGQSGRGVDLTLALDPSRARWIKLDASDTEYVTNRQFVLGDKPQLFLGLVHEGTLTLAVYQKGTSTEAVSYSGGLLSVALELEPSASTPAGTVLPLSVIKAHALPDSGALVPISVAVGTLTAR